MSTTSSQSMEVLQTQTRLTTWQIIKRNIGDFLSLFTCGLGSLQEELDYDDEVRRRVRAELHIQQGSADTSDEVDDMDQCIADVVRCNEYSMGTMKHIALANRGVKRTEKEWDAYFKEVLHLDPVTLAHTERKPRIVPKFAAHVALHIRSLLGNMEASEANIMLVERKYSELCRKRGVHIGDAERHKQHVMNAVFTEDVLERCGTARQRAPLWLRWSRGIEGPKSVKRHVC